MDLKKFIKSNSPILTSNGYVALENINIGDYVLTHNKHFKKITNINYEKIDDLYLVKTMLSDPIGCTKNQQFLVRNKYDKENRWVCASELSSDYFIACPIDIVTSKPIISNYVYENRLNCSSYGLYDDVNDTYTVAYNYMRTHKRPARVNGIEMIDATYKYQINSSNMLTDYWFYEDGFLWVKVRGVFMIHYNKMGYNIEVEEDEGYVVQNIVVK